MERRNKIDTLTSDENGKATSKELDPGDYILKEVQAPEGYELSDKEIEFTISNQKFEVVKLQITNKKKQKSRVKKQKNQAKKQKSQVKKQKSRVKKQKSQVKKQKSQAKKQKTR